MSCEESFADGYNQAVGEYEAFLPDEEEIKQIVEKAVPDLKMFRASMYIARAIAKRIGKNDK